MNWYNIISNDISRIDDCIDFYEQEYNTAKWECKIKGSIEKASAALPGLVEHRFSQLQEIEAILEHLNIELKQLHSFHFRKYLETYARSLSSRDCEKYVEGEQDIVDFSNLVNRFALIRNQYLAICKGFEVMQWQLTNIVKLRCAGMEDVTL